MSKTAAGIVVSVCMGLLLLASASAQDEMTQVDNRSFRNPQRPASVFQHDAHNEAAEIEECNECHHIYENGVKSEDESSEDQMCADCHTQASGGDRPTLLQAFHGNCKGCHLQRTSGPILCGQCHVNP